MVFASPSLSDAPLTRDEIAAAQPRVGRTPAERLDWAIRFSSLDLGTLTRGDWSNLRLELTAFAGLLVREQDVAAHSRDRPRDRLRRFPDELLTYSSDDVAQLHREFSRIIGGLLQSDHVNVGRYEMTLTIERWPTTPSGATRPVRLKTWFPPGVSRATHVLAHLLGIHGHLVKACPAPLSRGRADEQCGRWFLARRPNQVYCTTRCQSRATTRASREARPGTTSRRRHHRRG